MTWTREERVRAYEEYYGNRTLPSQRAAKDSNPEVQNLCGSVWVRTDNTVYRCVEEKGHELYHFDGNNYFWAFGIREGADEAWERVRVLEGLQSRAPASERGSPPADSLEERVGRLEFRIRDLELKRCSEKESP